MGVCQGNGDEMIYYTITKPTDESRIRWGRNEELMCCARTPYAAIRKLVAFLRTVELTEDNMYTKVGIVITSSSSLYLKYYDVESGKWFTGTISVHKLPSFEGVIEVNQFEFVLEIT